MKVLSKLEQTDLGSHHPCWYMEVYMGPLGARFAGELGSELDSP